MQAAEDAKEQTKAAAIKKKRQVEADSKTNSTKKAKSTPLDKSKIKRPSKNHPIYGEEGIMRGILWYRTGTSTNMCLDGQYTVKDAHSYGHNGLEIGAWFPRLMAALRDGAHGLYLTLLSITQKLTECFHLGERMAGVAGSPETGAWSVVVSDGGYGGIDKDLGDVIIYSAPGAFDTKAKTAEDDRRGAKCLLRSYETKRPIRVLRGKTAWKFAPSCGYRYDGLYQVEEKGEGKNDDGGVYIWVKLVRLLDQEPIDRKKPDFNQRRAEEKVSRGY